MDMLSKGVSSLRLLATSKRSQSQSPPEGLRFRDNRTGADLLGLDNSMVPLSNTEQLAIDDISPAETSLVPQNLFSVEGSPLGEHGDNRAPVPSMVAGYPLGYQLAAGSPLGEHVHVHGSHSLLSEESLSLIHI